MSQLLLYHVSIYKALVYEFNSLYCELLHDAKTGNIDKYRKELLAEPSLVLTLIQGDFRMYTFYPQYEHVFYINLAMAYLEMDKMVFPEGMTGFCRGDVDLNELAAVGAFVKRGTFRPILPKDAPFKIY